MDDLKLMRDAGASMSPRCKMGFDRADNGTVSRVNPPHHDHSETNHSHPRNRF